MRTSRLVVVGALPCRPLHALCVLLGTKSYNGPGPDDAGTFNTMSGTSWSTGEITGIVVQLFQADPSATAGQIENALKLGAHQNRMPARGSGWRASATRGYRRSCPTRNWPRRSPVTGSPCGPTRRCRA